MCIRDSGRGGSAGRGGGPIQATLRSLPPNSVNGKIRITDQGEVIQQKYGYEPLAKYNLCSYIGAVTEATLNPPPTPKNNWRDLTEKMSDIAKSSYRKNINQSSDFIKYFKIVTPHVALGKLSIGSRPSKRKNVDNIKSLRAIPWVFAWTQVRLMLPAWLGSTEALRYAYHKRSRKTLFDMEKNWPFFNAMLDMLDMVISKVDPDISKIYEEFLADASLKRVGKKLRFQFDVIKKLNKKMYQSALRSVLSELVRQDRIVIIKEFVLKSHKTKELASQLSNLNVSDVLIVTTEVTENITLASRNLRKVNVCKPINLDLISLIKPEKVLIIILLVLINLI